MNAGWAILSALTNRCGYAVVHRSTFIVTFGVGEPVVGRPAFIVSILFGEAPCSGIEGMDRG